MANEKILIVDDEKSMRDFLKIMLAKEGYDVKTFSRGEAAIKHFKENAVDLVISDIKMPGMNGVELLKELKAINEDIPVLMITAYASVDTAIDAMKSGAYDYFTKPFNNEEIKVHITRALEKRRLQKENAALKHDVKSRYGFSGIIGTGKKMTAIYELVMSVAPTKSNVFITGESGTGKELIARAIHQESTRKEMPFVALNCGAIPENLIESELFGHQKGAFTGAVSNKEGLVEMADGGTLFLDEITELPLKLQVTLLRFIQERVFRRVGGTKDLDIDVRLVAASNREVEREVKEGRFRDDLFYRLNVIRIEMPSLRERAEDIPLLARHFLGKYATDLKKDIESISEDSLALLVDYDFSGNVRELENIIERAVALEKSGVITTQSLPAYLTGDATSGPGATGLGSKGGERSIIDLESVLSNVEVPPEGLDVERVVSELERNIIMDALEKADGVKTKAAELLGLSFRSFRYKLDKYDNS
ncbi:MAG: sigma-54 dependent transcriptional regulator [Thermodesulfobacteriota bacterium]